MSRGTIRPAGQTWDTFDDGQHSVWLTPYVLAGITQAMDLRTWLSKPGHTKYGLAKRSGLTWKVIHKVAQGHIPRAETAHKIADATDGEVTAAEILGVAATGEAA